MDQAKLRAMMYGPATDTTPKKKLDENALLDLIVAPAGKAITIKLAGDTLIAASAMHAQELEKEIGKLHRDIKNLESQNRKLVNSYNKLVTLIRNMELELQNQVDKLN
jgi:chaperonin cofactor prefoldin